MSITINFTASSDSDVASVRVWEATTSDGAFTLVQTTTITQATTSVTYSAGLATRWYRISFVDNVGNESDLSAAIYGAGEIWYNYMIPLIRVEIGDTGTTQVFTDLALKKKLVIAANQLDTEGRFYEIFDYNYLFSIDNGDGSGWNITPDPIYASFDRNFLSLWILKTLCSHARASLVGATSNAIKIKDGDSSIDTTAGFSGYKELISANGGPCKAYTALMNQLVLSSKNGVKQVYANFGSDHIHRPSIVDTFGGIDRSSF
jgi:hypothetical protein